MELGQYVSDLQRQLVDGAENGTEDTRAVAERLAAGLDATARLVLLDALSAAVGEITRDLAPGSVDMRLRGREGSDEHAHRRESVSMPTYNTPTPIDLAINLQVGRIEVFASDRADTITTVSATSPAKAVDRRGVEETKVDFDGQRVTITGPRPRISWIGPGPFDSVDVLVELPSGARVTAEI